MSDIKHVTFTCWSLAYKLLPSIHKDLALILTPGCSKRNTPVKALDLVDIVMSVDLVYILNHNHFYSTVVQPADSVLFPQIVIHPHSLSEPEFALTSTSTTYLILSQSSKHFLFKHIPLQYASNISSSSASSMFSGLCRVSHAKAGSGSSMSWSFSP